MGECSCELVLQKYISIYTFRYTGSFYLLNVFGDIYMLVHWKRTTIWEGTGSDESVRLVPRACWTHKWGWKELRECEMRWIANMDGSSASVSEQALRAHSSEPPFLNCLKSTSDKWSVFRLLESTRNSSH